LAEIIELNVGCELAERDRKKDPRIYAHVDHAPYGVICIVADLVELPRENQLGILWHEIGHLLSDVYDVDPTPAELADAERIYHDRTAKERVEEAKANAAAREVCSRPITYGPDDLQRTH
jgi:hypothetical protein